MVYDADRNARLAEKLVEAEQIKGRSLWQDAAGRFMRNKAAVGAMIVLILVLRFTLVGPFLAQWTNEEIDWARMGDIAGEGGPSLSNGHFFGLDEVGRDLFSRTIQATQTSLIVGVIGALMAVVMVKPNANTSKISNNRFIVCSFCLFEKFSTK